MTISRELRRSLVGLYRAHKGQSQALSINRNFRELYSLKLITYKRKRINIGDNEQPAYMAGYIFSITKKGKEFLKRY